MWKWIVWGVATVGMVAVFWPLALFMLFITPILAIIVKTKAKREETTA